MFFAIFAAVAVSTGRDSAATVFAVKDGLAEYPYGGPSFHNMDSKRRRMVKDVLHHCYLLTADAVIIFYCSKY